MSYNYKKTYDDDDDKVDNFISIFDDYSDSDSDSGLSKNYSSDLDDLISELSISPKKKEKDIPLDFGKLSLSEPKTDDVPLDFGKLSLSEPKLTAYDIPLDFGKLSISEPESTEISEPESSETYEPESTEISEQEPTESYEPQVTITPSIPSEPLKLDVAKLLSYRQKRKLSSDFDNEIDQVEQALSDFFVSDNVKSTENEGRESDKDELSKFFGKIKISPKKKVKKESTFMDVDYDPNAPRYFLRQIIKKPSRFSEDVQLIPRKQWSVKKTKKKSSKKDKGKGKGKERDRESEYFYSDSEPGPSTRKQSKSKPNSKRYHRSRR